MAQECRNVINNGIHIATVCMPTGRPETEWTAALAPYALMTGIPPVPLTVNPVAFRRALRELNIYVAFVAAVETLSPEIQDGWEYSIEYRRGDATISAVTTALGYTSAFVDSIYRKAATYS